MFKNKKNDAITCMTEITKKALDGRYAIAQININNLEWIKATLEAVKETNTPVILGVSEGAAKYMCGYENVVDMVSNVMNQLEVTQPVVIHLDHGTYEGCVDALKAGFSSVMFDGSHLEFEANLEKTKKVIKLANKTNASVEAEVGSIGGDEDGVAGRGELADIEQCRQMAELDIAALAAGIGNIHGIYPENWKGLDLERLKEIMRVATGKPLVLHGGTGIPADQIQNAIIIGVSKINVNTECQLAFANATRKYIAAGKDLDTKAKGFDPRKLLKAGTDAIKAVVIEKFTQFGSLGKA